MRRGDLKLWVVCKMSWRIHIISISYLHPPRNPLLPRFWHGTKWNPSRGIRGFSDVSDGINLGKKNTRALLHFNSSLFPLKKEVPSKNHWKKIEAILCCDWHEVQLVQNFFQSFVIQFRSIHVYCLTSTIVGLTQLLLFLL